MPTPTRRTLSKPSQRRKPPEPEFQEPLLPNPPPAPEQPKLEPGRPTKHKGIPVVREELRKSQLPTVNAALKISKLHLADETYAFACRDCLFTADSLAEVMHHRNDEHGSKYGKKHLKVIVPPDSHLGDVVLAPRGAGVPAPANIMEMTMAEVMSLLPSIAALGDLISRTEAERDEAVEELKWRRQEDYLNGPKLAAYDSLQAELVERRMTMKGHGSYEDLKAEVTDLRAWKKSIIKRFSAIGFTFNEEDK